MNPQINYQSYLKSDYWKTVSRAVKARAGYRCQVCNSQHDLEAHHRCYDHRGNELDHLNDLVCLCRRCHAVFHGKLNEPPQPKQSALPSNCGTPRPKTQQGLNQQQIAWVNAYLPDADPIVLTTQLVMTCRTDAFGLTNETIRALGVKPPLVKGWVKRLEGQVISREDYRKALGGRFIYNSGKLI